MNRKYRSIETLEARTLLSSAGDILIHPALDLSPQVTGTTVTGLTPAQVKKAYGFDLSTFTNSTVKGDGTGQTIAIVDAYNDPNIKSDLTTFDKKFSLVDPPSFKIVGQTGGSTSSIPTDGGWSTEIALDVEWAHAIAPKANILLVEAKSESITDLMAGVNYARSAAGVSVVSLSWGGSEFWGETSYDKNFTTPAGHQGVTFVAAAGDEGSTYYNGAEWPAVSPNVLAVGGTDLTLNSTGSYGSETGWRDSSGGISRFEPEPAYQKTVQSTGGKTTPDVAYDADPNTGFAIYSSVPDEGYSGWEEVGGTSAGTPQWGALIAIADQGRVLSGKTTLDGATGTLPALYKLSTSDFHDITSGRSGRFNAATVGYDLVTGLGTPHANVIISGLIGGTTSSPSTKLVAGNTAAPAIGKKTARAPIPDDPEMPAPPPPLAPAPGGTTIIGSAPGNNASKSGSNSSTTTTTLSQAQAAVTGLTTLRKVAVAGAAAAGPAAAIVDVTTVAKSAASAIEASASSAMSDTHLGGGASAIFSTLAIDSSGAIAQRAAGDILASAAEGIAAGTARLARSVFAESEPFRRTFHFERLGDPMALISDAAATFADESALLGSVAANSRYTKAWAITFTVIAADAAVVLYWSRSRKRTRVTANAWSYEITGGEI